MKEYFIVSSYNDKEKINNLTTTPTVYESLQAYKDSGKKMRKGLYVWKVRTNEQYNSGDKIKESDAHNLRLVGDMSAWQEYSSDNVQPITESQEQHMVEAAQEQQPTQVASDVKEGHYINYGLYEPPEYFLDWEDVEDLEEQAERRYEEAIDEIISEYNDFIKDDIKNGVIPEGDYSIEYEETSAFDIEYDECGRGDYEYYGGSGKGVFKHDNKIVGKVEILIDVDGDGSVTIDGDYAEDIYNNVLETKGIKQNAVKESHSINYGLYESPKRLLDWEDLREVEEQAENRYRETVDKIISDYNRFIQNGIKKGVIPEGDYSIKYEETSPFGIEYEESGRYNYRYYGGSAKVLFKHDNKIVGRVEILIDVPGTRSLTINGDRGKDIYDNVLEIKGVTQNAVKESEETDVDFWAEYEEDYGRTFFDGGISYDVLETLASDVYIDMNGFTGDAELVSCTPNGKDILYAVLLDGDPDMVDENEDSMRDHFYSIVNNPNYFDDAFMESYGCTKSCLESLRNIHSTPVGTQIVVEGYFVAREGSTQPKRVYKESRNYLKKRIGERIMYKCGDVMLTEQQLNYIVSNLYSTRKLARNSIREDVKPDGPSNITIRSNVVYENVDATTVGKFNYTAADLTDAGDTLSSSIEIQNTPQGYTWKDTTYTIDSGAVFDSIQEAAQNAMATVELNYPLYAIEWSELIPIN